MNTKPEPKPKPRPRPRTISQSSLGTKNNVTRSASPKPRSRSTNIAFLAQQKDLLKTENERLKEELKTCRGLKAENDELKSLLEVKNSMKGLNKMVSLSDFEELKKELDTLRERDELRTRMLTEDLRAFEETRQELILIQEKRIADGTWGRLDPRVGYNEEDKKNYMYTVISHLKLLIGISPRDLCINNIADDLLERAETRQRRGGGISHPYKVQYKTDNFLTDVTREEFIDAIKKGKIRDYEDLDNLCINDMKQNLLIKTIRFVGTK